MRTFIAIEIPSNVKALLRNEQKRLQDQLAHRNLPTVLRWTNTDNLHLTLRFLGETNEAQRTGIKGGLAEIGGRQGAFTLRLSGMGCFNSWNNLRVLWVGVGDEAAALRAVQKEVELLARREGFEAERRRFSPHITLARTVRNAPREARCAAAEGLRQAAQATETLYGIDWRVEELQFIRSTLGRGGAQYATVAHCCLATTV